VNGHESDPFRKMKMAHAPGWEMSLHDDSIRKSKNEPWIFRFPGKLMDEWKI
jgi:hypothetical protein